MTLFTVLVSAVSLSLNDYFAEKIVANFTANNITVEAVIISPEESFNDRYYYILKMTRFGEQKTNLKLKYSSSSLINANPYDILEINALSIYPISSSKNESQGVFLGAFGEITSVNSPPVKGLMSYIIAIRSYISSRINTALPLGEGAVASGILLGDTSQIDENTYDDVKDIGVSHIFSVSGLHISFWALFIYSIFGMLTGNKLLKISLSLLTILFIIALTGFEASANRAGIMFAVILFAELFSKQNDPLNSLGFAGLFMLLYNPHLAHSVSFIFSFTATASIFVFYEPFYSFFSQPAAKIKYQVLAKSYSFFAVSLSISLGVLLFTLPVMIYYYGAYSIISPLGNLLTIPLCSLAMLFTGAAAFFASVDFIFNPLISIAGIIVKLIIYISEKLSSLSLTQIPFDRAYFQNLILVLTIITAFIAMMSYLKVKKINLKRTYLLFCASMLAFTFVLSFIPTKKVDLSFCRVGNGSAVLITQNGKSALIGCGGKNNSYQSIKSRLNYENIRELDFLLIPRAEPTEANAAIEVINNKKPREIVMSEEYSTSEEFLEYNKNNDCNFLAANKYSAVICDNIAIEYINEENISACLLRFNGRKIIICFLPGSDFSGLGGEWQSSDILITRAAVPEYLSVQNFGAVVICNRFGTDMSERELELLKRGNVFFADSKSNPGLSVSAKGRMVLEYVDLL